MDYTNIPMEAGPMINGARYLVNPITGTNLLARVPMGGAVEAISTGQANFGLPVTALEAHQLMLNGHTIPYVVWRR